MQVQWISDHDVLKLADTGDLNAETISCCSALTVVVERELPSIATTISTQSAIL